MDGNIKLAKKYNIGFWNIGTVEGNKLIVEDNDARILNLNLSNIREKWHNSIWNLMG